MVNIFSHSLPERVFLVSPLKWLGKRAKRQKNIKIKDPYQEELDSSIIKGWFNSLIWPIFAPYFGCVLCSSSCIVMTQLLKLIEMTSITPKNHPLSNAFLVLYLGLSLVLLNSFF